MRLYDVHFKVFNQDHEVVNNEDNLILVAEDKEEAERTAHWQMNNFYDVEEIEVIGIFEVDDVRDNKNKNYKVSLV